MTQLHLSDNQVSSVGLKSVLKLKLEIVNIQGNTIGVELLHSLNQALKQHRLKQLFVSSVHLWNVSALSSFAEALLMSQSIKTVWLGECTSECVELLASIASNCQFKVQSYLPSKKSHENQSANIIDTTRKSVVQLNEASVSKEKAPSN